MGAQDAGREQDGRPGAALPLVGFALENWRATSGNESRKSLWKSPPEVNFQIGSPYTEVGSLLQSERRRGADPAREAHALPRKVGAKNEQSLPIPG